jgi:hypothetical protein
VIDVDGQLVAVPVGVNRAGPLGGADGGAKKWVGPGHLPQGVKRPTTVLDFARNLSDGDGRAEVQTEPERLALVRLITLACGMPSGRLDIGTFNKMRHTVMKALNRADVFALDGMPLVEFAALAEAECDSEGKPAAPTPPPDGPRKPNRFVWDGREFTFGRAINQWRLLVALWGKGPASDGTFEPVGFDDLFEAVYEEKDSPGHAGVERLRTNGRRLDEWLNRNGVLLEVDHAAATYRLARLPRSENRTPADA